MAWAYKEKRDLKGDWWDVFLATSVKECFGSWNAHSLVTKQGVDERGLFWCKNESSLERDVWREGWCGSGTDF